MRLLKTSNIVITRATGGYWNDKGRWEDGNVSPDEFSIDCSIQPFKGGRGQRKLPDGISTHDTKVVRTKTFLKTSEQIGEKEKADTTVIDGFTYEAFFDSNWSDYGLRVDHHKVIFIRQDQSTGGSL
jgi:hypothetical protein